jgi:hypothetical protein
LFLNLRQKRLALTKGHELRFNNNKAWLELGQSVKIKKYRVKQGLIYVGDYLPSSDNLKNDNCLINPNLEISKPDKKTNVDNNNCFPDYATLSPASRAKYLIWLDSGRCWDFIDSDKDNITNFLLYFFGLERRLFYKDQLDPLTTFDREAIYSETERLWRSYYRNQSLFFLISKFLEAQQIMNENIPRLCKTMSITSNFSPQLIQYITANSIADGLPLPKTLAFQWMINHPKFGSAKLQNTEHKLFYNFYSTRFKNTFGDGLILKPDNSKLALTYSFINPSLKGSVNFIDRDLPDPFNFSASLDAIKQIAFQCDHDCDHYSVKLFKRNPYQGAMSREKPLQWERLFPPNLPNYNLIREFLSAKTANGLSLTPLNEIYLILRDGANAILRTMDAEALAYFFERLGYGIIPDRRYYFHDLTIHDNVVLLPSVHGPNFKPSESFNIIANFIIFACAIRFTYRTVSAPKNTILHDFINNKPELSAIEKYSLSAYLFFCVNAPVNLLLLKKIAKSLDKSALNQLALFLFDFVRADGTLHTYEAIALEDLYDILQYDKKILRDYFFSLALDPSLKPVPLAINNLRATDASPARATVSKFSLNETLIANGERETLAVRSIINDIFAKNELDSTLRSNRQKAAREKELSDLDKPFADLFLKLASQTRWDRATIASFCAERDIMMDGALEIINEWAFAKAKAPLLDGEDPLFLDPLVAAKLKRGDLP